MLLEAISDAFHIVALASQNGIVLVFLGYGTSLGAICCRMGCRTGMSFYVKVQVRYRAIFGER